MVPWAWGLLAVVGVVGELAALINWIETDQTRWRVLVLIFGISALIGAIGLLFLAVDIAEAIVQHFL